MKQNKRWFVALLMVAVLVLGLAAVMQGLAEEGSWPPVGKVRGTCEEEEKDSLTGVYLSNLHGDSRVVGGVVSEYFVLHSAEEANENEQLTGGKLTFVTGDEALRDAFQLLPDESKIEFLLYDAAIEGEATYQLDLESEHYWTSFEFTAKVVDVTKVEVQFDFDTVTIFTGEEQEATDLVDLSQIKVTPGVPVRKFYLASEESEWVTETDAYALNWGKITARQEGDYKVRPRIRVGEIMSTSLELPDSMTLHIGSEEEKKAFIAEQEEIANADWDASWPPAGKSEAEIYWVERWSGLHLVGDEGTQYGAYTRLEADDISEPAIRGRVVFLEGDEALRNYLSFEIGGGEGYIQVNGVDVPESGSATFRIELESEHYYASAEVTPHTLNMGELNVELISNVVNVPLEQQVGVPELFRWRQFFITDPEIGYYCNLMTPEGEYSAENAAWELGGGWGFTAHQAGEYPMMLLLQVDSGMYDRVGEFPIIIRASENVNEAAVEGDAPLTAYALEQIKKEEEEARRAEEEAQKAEEEARQAEFEAQMNENTRTLETESGTLLYEVETNQWTGASTVTITGALLTSDTLVIPGEIEGYPVKVGFGAIERTGELKTLILEEGVTEIEKQSFSYCENLTTVQLPESLKTIGMYAFMDDHALAEVKLPEGLTKDGIGYWAFQNVGLKDLVLADGTSLALAPEGDEEEIFSTWVDGWSYQHLADGTIRITEADTPYDAQQVTVPAEIDSYPVSELGESALGYHHFEEITLPDTLKVIGDRAFSSCDQLKAIALPEGLTTIGERAFDGCTALAEVNLPESLTYVGERAFANVAAVGLKLPEAAKADSDALWYYRDVKPDSTGLWEYGLLADDTAVITKYNIDGATLVIPAELDGVKVTAVSPLNTSFDTNQTIKKLALPDDLMIIGEDAFIGFNVSTVKLPEGVIQIGKEAFASCENLSSINLPEGLISIGEGAFSHCDKLKSIKLPSTLRRIGDKAFYYCRISAVTFPESLESIGEEAFLAHKMSQIVIPASVKKIGDRAFHPNGEKYPTKVTFEGMTTELGIGIFGSFSNRTENGRIVYDYYADDTNSKTHTITLRCYPGSTADLKYNYNVKKNYLKWGAEGIATTPGDRVLQAGWNTAEGTIFEVIVPEGVEEIGEDAFAGMTTLCKITLPSTLMKIGDRAFDGCSALNTLVLPKKFALTAIGTAAFRECSKLTSMTLPDGITEIPEEAFQGCSALSKLTLPKSTLTKIGKNAFAECTALTQVTLAKGLEEIGELAFYRSGVKTVKVPDTVTTIGTRAFAVSKLTSLTLPKDLTEIPMEMCIACYDLKSVKMPNAAKTIGNGAFALCYSLSSITLPEGLQVIEDNAFMQDARRAQLYWRMSGGKKTATALKSLKLPASLTKIGEQAFGCNDALTTVTFAKGSQLTEIGDNAFAMCLHLKEITLPDSLRTVGAWAFVNCLNLKKVNLGAGVTAIGEKAFLYDDAMTSLTVPDTLTDIGADLLEGYGKKLKVTCVEGSAMEEYLKAHYPDVEIVYPKK